MSDSQDPLPHKTPAETRATVASKVVEYLVWSVILLLIVGGMALYSDELIAYIATFRR